MSRPRESDLRRLRNIRKYLIGKPRLVSLFPWQSMPDRVTGFTDSDWAGCSKTAKSTSGGAICLGEHVVKTYCRQQKVVALSSAEAELYAMVAASAETLAIAAYAKDLGLELQCELYCDSAAALGITQRAGIGKVRHLRTQGLWVQEVRVSGRIVYRKVLGEKNPADLLTKHMSAELSERHLQTLSMRLDSGRADIAPTLDSVESLVTSWYEREGFGKDIDYFGHRQVRFDSQVSVRAIPITGRHRRTPPRGQIGIRRAGLEDRDRRGHRDAGIADRASSPREEVQDLGTIGIQEPIEADMECSCRSRGLPQRGEGRRWADVDEDVNCEACRRQWGDSIAETRAEVRVSTTEGSDRPVASLDRHSSDIARSSNFVQACNSPGNSATAHGSDVDCGHLGHFSCIVHRPSGASDLIASREVRQCTLENGDLRQTSESGGHFEGGRPVRNLSRRSNSSVEYSGRHNEDAGSTMCSRRRRSVGDGHTRQRVYGCTLRDVHAGTSARKRTHVQAPTEFTYVARVCALPCSHTHVHRAFGHVGGRSAQVRLNR